MISETVKIGVVGVGHLGRLHALQLKQVPQAELVGIYDINPARAREVGEEAGGTVFPDFQELLTRVEALSIVTPTTTHYQYAREALLADKHVFIEKPMTESLAEADELLEIASQRKRLIQIGHIERFNPAILAVESLPINPLFIEAHRMANFNPRGTEVAVVLDLMIHDIDLILSFVNSPIKSVDASGVSIISGSEDIANCRMQFENGCVANVTASRISTRKMRKMRFFQPNAYISVDFLEGFAEVYYLNGDDIRLAEPGLTFSLGKFEKGEKRKEIRYARLEKKDVNPLRLELEHFCHAILTDTLPPVTGEDGRRALYVAELILESIEEHLRIVQQHWKL